MGVYLFHIVFNDVGGGEVWVSVKIICVVVVII